MRLLVLMIAVMPFEMNPHLTLADSFLGIFPGFTVIKLLGLVGLWWVIAETSAGRVTLDLFGSSQARALLLYIGSSTVAAALSGATMQMVTSFMAVSMLLPLVLAAVRSERDLRTVAGACVVVMILVYPYTLRQIGRYGGTLGSGLNDVNYFALQLLIVMPIAFGSAAGATIRKHRTLWILAGTVLTGMIIQTGSRGGFLGVVVVALLVAFRLSHHRLRALAGIVAVVVILLVLVPTPVVYRLLASGLDPTIEDTAVVQSNEARAVALQVGLWMIGENPLAGVGLGNFQVYKTLYATADDGPKLAHNTFLEIGAELGLITLAAFLALIVAVWRSLQRAAREARRTDRPALAMLAVGLQTSLAGYLIGSLFLSAQYEKFFWLIAFLSICCERISRATQPAMAKASLAQRAAVRIGR